MTSQTMDCQTMQERLTAGQLVALVEYMALMAWPSFALGWVISMWQRGSASMVGVLRPREHRRVSSRRRSRRVGSST